MPTRLIKDSICTSETLDQLTYFEEVFFYRLIVNCDDYGRLDARPAILKSRLFPLKSVTEKQINDCLNKLSTVGIAQVYFYDQRPYLQLATWKNHQNIRTKRSKYPSPDMGMQASEYKCIQMNTNVPVIQSNPIQSESNPHPNPEPENDDENVFKFYQKNISPLPSPHEMETIRSWLEDDEISPKLIIEFIKVTVEQNVKSIAYIKSIVSNCLRKGIRTVEAFEADRLNYASNKGDRSNKSGRGNVANFEQRQYTDEYLNTLITDVTKIEGGTDE